MSELIDFYRHKRPDHQGRFLSKIWGWDDTKLEEVHDYIQWLFPLPEPSRFNPNVPLLTKQDAATFRGDPQLQNSLERSFLRMLVFFGLSMDGEGRVVDHKKLATRVPDVWMEPNHNWLRISRILRCLRLVGLEDDARSFYAWLAENRGRFPIDEETFSYWSKAVEGT